LGLNAIASTEASAGTGSRTVRAATSTGTRSPAERHDGEGLPVRAEHRAFGAGVDDDRAGGYLLHGIEEFDRRSGVPDRERPPVRRDRDPLPLASGG
jgi:hypothetical protein